MESVGDILERVCPCGGDPTGPMHQESLLHRRWLLGQAIPDALATPDRRSLDRIDSIRIQERVRPDLP